MLVPSPTVVGIRWLIAFLLMSQKRCLPHNTDTNSAQCAQGGPNRCLTVARSGKVSINRFSVEPTEAIHLHRAIVLFTLCVPFKWTLNCGPRMLYRWSIQFDCSGNGTCSSACLCAHVCSKNALLVVITTTHQDPEQLSSKQTFILCQLESSALIGLLEDKRAGEYLPNILIIVCLSRRWPANKWAIM